MATLPRRFTFARQLPSEDGTPPELLTFLFALAGFIGYIASYSPLGGSRALVLFFVAWAGYVVLRPQLLAQPFRFVIPWLLPVLAVLSVLWSRDPSYTLRTSVELCATTGIALFAGRALTTRGIVALLFVTFFILIAPSQVLGGTETIFETGQSALNGLFGSKNNFGMVCGLLILCSLGVALGDSFHPALRLAALFALATGVAYLLMARTVGGVVAALAASSILIGMLALGRLKMSQRTSALIGGMLLAMVIGSVFLLEADAIIAAALESVNKDPTLTGRDVMWRHAEELISRRPLLGMGYMAFWRQGYAEAEALWQLMKVVSRGGFTFHNLYYQIGVELGLVGVIMMGLMVIATLIATFIAAIRHPSAEQSTIFALTIFFMSRVTLEVDFYYPFNFATLLYPLFFASAMTTLRQQHAGPSMRPARPVRSDLAEA